MEIVEIITHYIDKTKNVINVEFRVLGDDEDTFREDLIEYSFFEEFGFDDQKNFEILDSLVDEDEKDEWFDENFNYIENEDDLILFLNEYYVVYPNKLPKIQLK